MNFHRNEMLSLTERPLLLHAPANQSNIEVYLVGSRNEWEWP